MKTEQKSLVDRILSACAIVSVVLAVVCVAWVRGVRVEKNADYTSGDRLDIGEAVSVVKGHPALVVWMESTCTPCRDSATFYKRLAANSGKVRMVIVGPEPVERLRAFADEHGIQPSEIVSTNGDWHRFTATPRLLLVDEKAVVRQIWLGRLQSGEQEDAVLRILHEA